MNVGMQISVRVPAFKSFGCIPRSGTAGLYDKSIFNILRTITLFAIVAEPFYVPTNREQRLEFLTLTKMLFSGVFVCFFVS